MRKRILSALLALCLVLALLPGSTQAAVGARIASGPLGPNLTWTYDSNTTTLTISGKGPLEDYYPALSGADEVVTHVIIEPGITTCSNLFERWSKLSSVKLPDGLLAIEDWAFYDCPLLTEIHIPDSVGYIGSYAFRESGLTEVNIPSSLAIINSATFSGCTDLQTVHIPSDTQLALIDDRAFENCNALENITIPEGVLEIGRAAFRNCTPLTKIVIPEGVEYVGSYAFAGCSNLTHIDLPSSWGFSDFDGGSIGEYTFSNCASLTEITIPAGITRIGRNAFEACNSLTTVNIPGSVTDIGVNAFLDCDKLADINYGAGIRQWNSAVSDLSDISELGISNPDIIHCCPGGTCGNNAYWYYDETEHLLYIRGPSITGPAPDDDNADVWRKALDDPDLFIYARYPNQILTNDFSGKTIHCYGGNINPDYDDTCGATIHFLEEVPASPWRAAELCERGGNTEGFACENDRTCKLPESLAPKQFGSRPHEANSYSQSSTCVSSGFEFGTICYTCHEVLVEPIETPRSEDHTCGATISEVIISLPTENKSGSEIVTYECKYCGTPFSKQWPISPSSPLPDVDPSDPDKTPIHTITFDPCGGEHPAGPKTIQTDSYRRLIALPSNPTREDYVFNGWYTTPSGGTKITTILPFLSDATVYANWVEWTEHTYVITFDANDGTAGGSIFDVMATGDDGRLTALPSQAPVREGYTFDGWYTAQDDSGSSVTTGIIFDGDTTVYAHWTKNSGDDKPDAPKEFTITFDANGGKLSSGTEKATTSGGKLFALPQAAWSGHTFQGWFTEKDGGTQVSTNTVFDKDATVYAHWTESSAPDQTTYTVTFNSQGGSAVPAQTVANGGKASSPSAPTRSGYTFGGWFREAACTTAWNFASDTVTANVTLYAKWTANTTTPSTPSTPTTYTVTFDPNGGSGGATLATGTDGRLSSLPANPSYAGYTFDGWYTAISGGTRVTTSTVFQTNTTVYAHWSRTSSTPSTASYQIYTPGNISGGSYSVSHNSAVEGTLVTIQLSPWGNYALNRLSAARTDTGGTLPLTGRSSNQFTFVMPASDVRLAISYTEKSSSSSGYPYNQPPVSARPIKWYFSNGCIYHVTDGLVPFTSPLTRDMLVSVLYNMDAGSSGDPTVWAASNGIVPDIYANWIWGRDKAITREQTAAILFCYAQHMGYNTAQRASLAEYSDSRQIRPGAWPAMSWSRAAGLITGTSSSTLSPQEFVTCAQANTILSRFVSRVAGTR